MVILIGVEKAFDRIPQSLFMIKTLSKLGIKEAFVNLIIGIFDKL